jgi:hypothetical protein
LLQDYHQTNNLKQNKKNPTSWVNEKNMIWQNEVLEQNHGPALLTYFASLLLRIGDCGIDEANAR